jgi:hypothetical protein
MKQERDPHLEFIIRKSVQPQGKNERRNKIMEHIRSR